MPKIRHEYAVAYMNADPNIDGTAVFYMPGEDQYDIISKGDDVESYAFESHCLNMMGENGWILLTVTRHEDSENVFNSYYFTRAVRSFR